MPQSVEIPGHGTAEFPDDMSPDAIKGVIQEKFFSQQGPASPSPEPLPSPPITQEEPTTLGKTLGAILSGPGTALQTAANITGGAITGDLSNPDFNPRPTTEDIQRPNVSPEFVEGAAKQTFPLLRLADVVQNLYPTTAGATAQGLTKGAAETIAGLSSMENVGLTALTGPLAGEAKAAQFLLAGTFGTKAAIELPDQWKAFNETTDPVEKARIGFGMLASLGLPAFAGAHAALGKSAVKPPALPEARLGESVKSIVGEKGGEENAIIERPITEGGQPERAPVSEGGASTEASRSDSPAESGPLTPEIAQPSLRNRLASAQNDLRAAQAAGDAEATSRASQALDGIAEEMLAPAKTAQAEANANVTTNAEINPVREVSDTTVFDPTDTEMAKKAAESDGFVYDQVTPEGKVQITDSVTGSTFQMEPGSTLADLKAKRTDFQAKDQAEVSAREAQVPEHLRPAPELVELLNPSKSVVPKSEELQLAGKEEGGALFSGGGKRTSVKAAGLTPKGDAEFIKIEPAWKRSVKGLERKGAADVIGETKNTVGKALADATRRHVDVEQELFGQLSAPLVQTIKGQRKPVTEKAFGEVSTYFADKENGRSLPTLSPEASKLVKEWENIAEKTGQIATANNVQVFDPALEPKGGYRPMHQMGKDFVPRMLKPEVERVMRDPESNPTLWNDLVDDFAKQRGISVNDAANELRSESGRFSSSDFMGNLEMARTGKMPESFYDYDMRSLVSRFLPAFSERMSQIIAYGQRLGPREAPLRENLWDVARKEAANSYTQEWLINAEDQAVNLKGRGASARGMARAQTVGSGLLLSSPTTVLRNLLSGVSATPELLGARRSLQSLADIIKNRQVRMDAREIGAVRDNMGDFLHVDRLGESFVDDAIRDAVDAGLKYSGYNGSEVFVRSHGALTASQFAKDGIAEIAKNPASRRSKEALALFKRMGADAEKIVAEAADWKTGPETRKFIRTVIRDTQGGYRFDQVPLWANSNMGRFFYQFGRWGTQRSRNIWNNGIKPALGEEVQWKGKTMTRRDVLPLAKMLGGAVLLGETFAGIAQVLFGRDRRDASVSEIQAAWQDDDQKKVVALALERMVNDVIMAGTLGIWGQPIDWAKGFKNQSRLKNPAEPPGLSSVRAAMDLAQDAIDQGGRVTRKDLLNFAASAAPGIKQATDVARNVLDEPLYEAENDVKTLRAAGQRWARGSGVDISPNAKGDFRKSALAPEYEPIKEALLVGDTDRASFLSSKFLDAQPDHDKALRNLKASVRQSQPFRVGPYTSEEKRADFMAWAEHNLNKDDFNQAQRIQERYMKAAQDTNLW